MDAAAVEIERNPEVSTRFSPSMENEQADAGRDGWTRLARPNSQAQTGLGEYQFSLSADREQEWQPYPVDPVDPYSAICDDHIHTY